MKKKILSGIFILMSLLSYQKADAQYLDPRYALHISNPLGMLTKIGIKAEYRLNLHHAFLGSYTNYSGFFPGYQVAIEYRVYYETRRKADNLIYGKLGGGFADYKSKNSYKDITIFGDGRTYDAAPGNYFFPGAGVGRHFNFDWFFMEVNCGLKFAIVTKPPEVYNEHIFYLTGPGAIPDINFHFGIQF